MIEDIPECVVVCIHVCTLVKVCTIHRGVQSTLLVDDIILLIYLMKTYLKMMINLKVESSYILQIFISDTPK